MYYKLLLPSKSLMFVIQKSNFFFTFLFTPTIIFSLMLEALRFPFPSVNCNIGSLFDWIKSKQLLTSGDLLAQVLIHCARTLIYPVISQLCSYNLNKEQQNRHKHLRSRLLLLPHNYYMTCTLSLFLPFFQRLQRRKIKKKNTIHVKIWRWKTSRNFPHSFLFFSYQP